MLYIYNWNYNFIFRNLFKEKDNMIYVYDILVNFIDSNRIYEVFEWNNKDDIEHIKRIPLFLCDYNLIDSILNYDVYISKEFLNVIENKTILYKNNNEKIKYACLLTEGSRVYALEFNESGKIEYKSSLLFDEEEEVLELSLQLENYKIDYKKIDLYKEELYLTRKLEQRRNYIIKDLKYTYNNKNYSKLRYLYNECFITDKTSNKEKYNRLISSINSLDSPIINKLNYILKLSHNSTCK